MKRIALLSDTHGFWSNDIDAYLIDCDEIWHAGDIGTTKVLECMKSYNKELKVIWGNIDDSMIRNSVPEIQLFELEGMKFLMIHIGGYPGKYVSKAKALIVKECPDVFICGHSHILKVMMDQQLNCMTLNPGAIGQHGFHKNRTMLKFDVNNGRLENMHVIDLGKK